MACAIPNQISGGTGPWFGSKRQSSSRMPRLLNSIPPPIPSLLSHKVLKALACLLSSCSHSLFRQLLILSSPFHPAFPIHRSLLPLQEALQTRDRCSKATRSG